MTRGCVCEVVVWSGDVMCAEASDIGIVLTGIGTAAE